MGTAPPLPEYSFHRTILDAMPAPMFIVDKAGCVVDFNTAAGSIVGEHPSVVLHRRGGEVLHCLNALRSSEGCGNAPACRDCVVRNSVGQVFSGGEVSRRVARMETIRGAEVTEVHMLVTAVPIQHHSELLVLLVLEDISELTTLRAIVPICAGCRKIRNDQEYWENLDTYFHKHLDINFSHGICPECMARLYPEFVSEVGSAC